MFSPSLFFSLLFCGFPFWSDWLGPRGSSLRFRWSSLWFSVFAVYEINCSLHRSRRPYSFPRLLVSSMIYVCAPFSPEQTGRFREWPGPSTGVPETDVTGFLLVRKDTSHGQSMINESIASARSLWTFCSGESLEPLIYSVAEKEPIFPRVLLNKLLQRITGLRHSRCASDQ